MRGGRRREPAPGIPWYVHPAVAPGWWARLPDVVEAPGFIVVNVHDGPGPADDPYYPSAVAALGSTRHFGYVDVDYGRRPVDDVASDIEQWVGRYGSGGVMLDQLPAGEGDAAIVGEYVAAARRHGAATVVGNPGVIPVPEVLQLLDIACVVEVTAATYLGLDLRVPSVARAVGIWHLVHTCPPEIAAQVRARAVVAGVDYLHVTAQAMPHPWQGFDEAVA